MREAIKYASFTILLLLPTQPKASVNQPDTRRSSQVISVGVSLLPKEMDPMQAWNVQQFLINQAVYETLVRVAENGNIIGDLASRWEISDTGTIYTFHLNPKAIFHNGQPVTAKDVIWSLSRHLWPESNSVVANYLSQALGEDCIVIKDQSLSCLNAINDHTLQLKLSKPYPPLLYMLAMPAFGVLPNKKSSSSPVGSGPMTAVFETKTETWHLRSFPQYAGMRPKLKEIIVQKIEGIEEIKKALQSGQLDVAMGLSLGEAADVTLPEPYQIKSAESLAFLHLFLNMDHPIFSNPDLRRDLAKMVQSQLVASKITRFHEFQPHYIPRGILPPRYYQRSKETMTPAEFKQRWGKTIENSPIRISLRKQWFSNEMALTLEKIMNQAGFKITMRKLQPEEYRRALEKGDYDMISGAYMGNFPDPDGFLDPLRKDGKLRMGRIPTDELMSQLKKIRPIKNPSERLSAYVDALLKFEEQMYFIPLFRMRLPIIYDSRISIPDSTYRYESELWKLFWDK